MGDGDGSNGLGPRSASSVGARDGAPETSYESGKNGHKIAFDPRDISESAERSKQPRLTLMEEVLLLGLKDKQVCQNLFLFSFLSVSYTWRRATRMRLRRPEG